jgi:hypothetical protein
MVVKESMNEARMLATIAPDEAFNGLIKHGVIRGNPLIANDDGITYSRIMPDGKNKITIDRNEAAAWVGDVINKTNNQYKLIEERRQLGEKVAADKDLDKAKTGNKIYVDQQQTNENIREKGYEYGLKTKLEGTKAGYDFGLARLRAGLEGGNIRLRASLEGASGGEGGDGGARKTASIMGGGPAAPAKESGAPSAAQNSNQVDIETLTPNEINKLKIQQEKSLVEADKNKRPQAAAQIRSNIKALDEQLKKKVDGVADQGKTMTGKFKALDTLILSKGRSSGEQNKLSAELTRMKNKYQLAQQRGEQFDQAQFQAEYDALLAKIRGGK